MDTFFQSFLPIVKAIESLMDQKKKPKISLKQDALHFYVVDYFEKGEQDKSAMEFFLFLKKRIASLDITLMPKGERDALVEILAVLERYISSFVRANSKVSKLLDKEIFSLRIGGMVPREYISKASPDIEFIRKNNLDKILFYHGISLRFNPERGIALPVKGPAGTIRDVYYRDLKPYSLGLTTKYSFDGEYLFEVDSDGLLTTPLMIEDEAITIHNTNRAFIVYRSGYPKASMEIHKRGQDLFLTLHDGKGSVYRLGVDGRRLVSPDRFAYHDEKGFETIVINCKEDEVIACIENLYTTQFQNIEELVYYTLMQFNLHDCITYYFMGSKLLSYIFVPKIIAKAMRGETSWKNIFTPWKVYEIDYSRLDQKGDELRKSLTL